MEKEAKLGILFFLLLISILALAFNIQTVRAIETIYIRSDGSIDPPTAPIQRDGDMYVLTDNIASDSDGIVIQRNNMTLDGAGYTLQGPGWGEGIFLSGRNNVTIRNMEIRAFYSSIFLESSSNNSIYGNNLLTFIDLTRSDNNNVSGNNVTGVPGPTAPIAVFDSSGNIISGNYVLGNDTRTGIHIYGSNNVISENTVTDNFAFGIRLLTGMNNSVFRNNVTNNGEGIEVDGSNHKIAENNIVNNVYTGIVLWGSLNRIYHNNLINNPTQLIWFSSYENFLDDGYPSGGNYWSDYTDVDLFSGPGQNETGSDGIWDHPYVIDVDNEDQYPLVETYSVLHDVAVTGVTIFDYETITATYNSSMALTYINGTVENQGNVEETFNVSIYYELAGQDELLTLETVTLSPGSSAVVTAVLNLTDFYVGYLTIVVEASEVASETDTSDNTFITQLLIKLPGDVNGDGCVDRYDAGWLALVYGIFPPMPPAPEDFDRDGKIGRFDAGLLSIFYGRCTVYQEL